MENEIQSSINQDERISQYLKGLMDSQEEIKFLADMESDEQLRQDAIAQARLIRGMSQVDAELIHILKTSSESKIISSIHPPKRLFRKPLVWVSVAASIALLLFTGYKGYDYYDTTRLGMEYATVFPMETLVRGGINSPVDTELHTLFENVVERKDLLSTTKRLSELWEISNQEIYNDYTDYAPYIGWYLAIGYLENYEKEKAQCILHTMLDDENVSLSIEDLIKELLKRL